MVRRSLAMDELNLGRLVLPFPKVKPLLTGLAYYLAAPRENLRRPEVLAFRDWIRVEARALRLGQGDTERADASQRQPSAGRAAEAKP